MLQVTDLTLRIAGRPLLEGASATVSRGERVGLIGPNGAGKTTLFRLIGGELQPDQGSLSITGGWRVGRVRQDAPSGPEPLIEVVLAADEERTRLLAELERTDDGIRLGEIHERLLAIGADAAPARAARILAGLGFSAEQQAGPASALSGGWRMRVALAGLLFAKPDLLLLDEPTNHLDLEATLWLEGFLKGYPGTILLISHDRTLLNNVCQRILHLEERKLVAYNGNYDTFERTRRERLERQSAMAQRQMAQRKHIQSFIDRFRYKASKARQAQSRIKALARMEPIASVVEQRTTSFTFPSPEELSPPLLALDGVQAGYEPGKPVLKRLNLRLDPDDRIGLLGANGNGKSTFMKLIAGRLQPLAGQIVKPGRMKVGYFAQDQTEELDLDATPLLLMERADPKGPQGKHRSHLARFGFDVIKAETRVGKLSGGEKARLLFALCTREAPHILLLDEPTNHLDIDAREALIHALNAYEGAVLLVSHDPHLLELVADRLWLVKDGGVQAFDGDIDDYRRLVMTERREEKQARREAEGRPAREPRRAAPPRPAPSRGPGNDLRRQVAAAEERLGKLNAARDILERRLADPAVYRGPKMALAELQLKLADITTAIAATEEQWLAAQSALEGA
jgi:ATP-binding cassette subfamily F protein 3